MHRTHRQLQASADPNLLELRILSNIATDKRFAFLRSDSPHYAIWLAIKSNKLREATAPAAVTTSTSLVAYGSSDEEGDAG